MCLTVKGDRVITGSSLLARGDVVAEGELAAIGSVVVDAYSRIGDVVPGHQPTDTTQLLTVEGTYHHRVAVVETLDVYVGIDDHVVLVVVENGGVPSTEHMDLASVTQRTVERDGIDLGVAWTAPYDHSLLILYTTAVAVHSPVGCGDGSHLWYEEHVQLAGISHHESSLMAIEMHGLRCICLWQHTEVACCQEHA